MTDELPPGWALTAVGTICPSTQYGYTASASGIDCGPRFLRITDIQDGAVNWGGVPFCEIAEGDVGKYAVASGDLLVARTGGTVGKSFLISHVPGPTVFASYLIRISPSSEVVPAFLYYFFQSASYWQQIGLKKGGLLGNVNATTLASIELPICSRPEQQRIVSKLDELFSRIDEGERALERVQKMVERYRQSVLKAAVTGELTRDWREKNKDKLESGEALLARILKARREAWEKAELDKMKAKGITPANDKWKQKYEEPAAPDMSDLPELPAGWAWASLEQVAAPEKYAITDGPFGSNLKTEHYTDIGPRVVRLQNIKDGVFADEQAHISPAHFDRLPKHHIFAGDLLIAALGESLPRVCMVPAELGPAIVKADCIRFKPSPLMVAECVMAFLNSPPSRKRTETTIHGVGRPRLNLEEIRALAVPVPPEAEQRAIADRIRTQVGAVDHLMADADQLAARVTALRQSILRQAFRGGLVSQDPADEPAQALFVRIAAERNEAPAKPKRGRKPKTSEPA